MNITETLAAIDRMYADGVIGLYAVGGAIGAAFYIEPAETRDIDIFVILKARPGQLLASLDPIYDYLRARGYEVDRDGNVVIEGWPVQFLEPQKGSLVEEAMEQAVDKKFGGTTARVFTAEHLAAIAFELGRSKDKLRLMQFFEDDVVKAGKFDPSRFKAILEKHRLLDRWVAFQKRLEA